MITTTKILNNNALVYTPLNYDKTKAYPCMIFHPGSGEMGAPNMSLSLLSAHGPFKYLTPTTDLGLDLIVVAIQPADPNPRPVEMQAYINAIKGMYAINSIIATGLSRGGQSWEWFVNNAESQLSEISALVLFSSQGTVADTPGIPGTYNPSLFVKHKVPFWWGIGTQDPFYAANLARYKALVALDPTLAVWTEWPGVGHSDPVWSDGYNPAWSNNSLKKSIYQWAAGFGQAVTIPVPPPVVVPPLKTITKVAITYSDGTIQSLPQI